MSDKEIKFIFDGCIFIIMTIIAGIIIGMIMLGEI